jgi:hypothetical protein
MSFAGLLDEVAHAPVAELLSPTLVVIDADSLYILELADIETD